MNYFEGINTIEELKKCYRKLAFEFHPDRGGSHEEMSEINNQYDSLFKKLKEDRQESTIDDGFKEVINKIINLNLKIEICGSWIWVSGNTKQYKDELKKAGFWWARKKGMWYWHPKEDRKRRKGSMSMEEIREKYGSQRIKKEIKVIA